MVAGAVNLLVLEGDGIGPEITAATLAVLRAAAQRFALTLAFEPATIGWAAHRAHGTTMPDAVFDKAKAADGIILGPVSHNEYPPKAEGGLNPSGEMRRRLDLYANIRPARSRPGFPPRCGVPVDLVVVRENTEGFYADRSMHVGPGEFMPTPDLALAMRKITRAGSTRIAEAAFKLARQRRRKVTCVHKANVLRVSDGLYLECTRAVAARYPDVAYEEQLIDAMAALLVRDASRFDVIVTTNMYRRHPVRRSLGDRRQPRARRLAQCRRRARRGAGAARLGAGYRRQEHRQSVVADRLGGDAARLARRAPRRRGARTSGAGDRGRARPRHRRSGDAHARHGRHARHRRLRRGGGEGRRVVLMRVHIAVMRRGGYCRTAGHA